MMELYKGYVPTKNKQSTMTFKNKTSDELMTLEQVKDLPEYAGVLNDETILIDIDDAEQAETLMQIIEELQIDCKVICTSRGKHFLFRNTNIDKCHTHVKTAIGLTVDIKIGTKNSYEVLKVDNTDRFVEWDVEQGQEYEELPVWLTPVKTKIDLLNMKEGEGRNSSLFGYELVLQSAGLTKDEAIDTLRLINSHILKEPLSEKELDVILRDDAFAKPVFFKGKAFLHDAFGDYLIREKHIVKIDDRLHVYDNGLYTDDVDAIYKTMRSVLPNIKKSQKSEVMDYLTDTAPRKKEADVTMIAFRNGVLNINTEEFMSFNPECYITNMIPWDYNKTAYDAEADAFLNRISCDDPDIRSLLEECIGYCFYRQNIIQKSFILIGEKNNGKSTFIGVLNRILGDDNVSAMDLKNLGDRFSKATLFKKLANIGDDISDEFIPDASLFKKIVSGDRIQAEFKGQNLFEFNPYVKLVFSANNMPRIRDKTGAVIRRLIMIPFNATFTEDDPDYEPEMKKILSTQPAMEYFIRIGVEGLKRVLIQKRFTKSKKVQKELDDYERQNHPEMLFFEELEESDILNHEPKEVYARYDLFCRDNGFQAMSQAELTKVINRMYGTEAPPRKISVGKGQRKTVRLFVRV